MKEINKNKISLEPRIVKHRANGGGQEQLHAKQARVEGKDSPGSVAVQSVKREPACLLPPFANVSMMSMSTSSASVSMMAQGVGECTANGALATLVAKLKDAAIKFAAAAEAAEHAALAIGSVATKRSQWR